jgi:hypothetical protein
LSEHFAIGGAETCDFFNDQPNQVYESGGYQDEPCAAIATSDAYEEDKNEKSPERQGGIAVKWIPLNNNGCTLGRTERADIKGGCKPEFAKCRRYSPRV